MSDLDERIAELQAELAFLQEKRRQRMHEYGSDVAQAEADCFAVITQDELNLAALPELARSILDALPAQIFIKEAAFDPQSGRRYTYINRTARDILGWTEEKAKSVFDSEAFAGGTDNPEWKKMFEGETETLKSRRSSRRELSWTANTEHGEAWRLNRVTEIPILMSGIEDPIGFCAIAQDIEFQLFAATHTQLRKIFRHEYGNLAASVLRHVKDAERVIKRTKKESLSTSPEGSDTSYLDKVLESLRAVEGYLLAAANVADTLYLAVGHIDQNSVSTVGKVASEVSQLFELAPFKVTVTFDDSIRSARILKPEAIKGLLVQLIGNAKKHYDESIDDVEIPVVARREGGKVCWVVSNRCQRLEGKLEFEPSVTREHFGAKIMGDVIKRAYGVKPGDMIEFPPAPTADGWIHVKLRCLVVED